jgi:hypothetical protein
MSVVALALIATADRTMTRLSTVNAMNIQGGQPVIRNSNLTDATNHLAINWRENVK